MEFCLYCFCICQFWVQRPMSTPTQITRSPSPDFEPVLQLFWTSTPRVITSQISCAPRVYNLKSHHINGFGASAHSRGSNPGSPLAIALLYPSLAPTLFKYATTFRIRFQAVRHEQPDRQAYDRHDIRSSNSFPLTARCPSACR